ncbi:MAG: alpha-amylase family glycosyl hydrolase [Planctomycetota bacterium]
MHAIRSTALGAAALIACAPPASCRAHDNPFAENPKAGDVFYHIMPMTWRDGPDGDAVDPNRFGDFRGIEAGLGYLDDLGITGYWLNPIFPSPAYHGYQHGPADQINPRLGTEQEFLELVSASHARGIEVYLDFVVYGISHDSVWFDGAFGNPSSRFDDWLAFKNFGNTQYTGATFPTWTGDTVGFIHWDLRNPQVKSLINEWGRLWLDPDGDGDPSDGIDGYRLDHVWREYNRGEHPEGWGYDLDPFWMEWHAALRDANPDVFTFAEQANWGIFGDELLPAFDAAFTKPFEFAARGAVGGEYAEPLYSTMAATINSLPERGTYMAIIGDHDVDRLSSTIGADSASARGRERSAAAVLMLQPFTPIIYQGDEIGMLGRKENYGSDANDIPMREPFKWSAVESAPMSRYHRLNFLAYNNSYSRNNDGRSVEEQAGVSGSLLETYRELIALRRDNVALHRGDYDAVPVNNDGVWAFLRRYEQGEGPVPDATQAVVALVNLRGQATTVSLDLSGFELGAPSVAVTDLRSGAAQPVISSSNQAGYAVAVPGYGYRVLEADVRAIAPPPVRVDGREIPADFAPGALVVTQDTPTALGDNNLELNQLFAEFDALASRNLHVGLTGNTDSGGSALCLFIDADPNAGVSSLDFTQLNPPPNAPLFLTGSVFDPGFEPETMILANQAGGTVYVDEFTLSAGGFVKTYRGSTPASGGSGVLTGSTTPRAGFQLAYDGGNLAGVTTSSVAGADTATRGFEILLPNGLLAEAMTPCREIRVMAMLRPNYSANANQSLPGVANDSVNLDPTRFDRIAGEQFVRIRVPGPADMDPGDGGATIFDIIAFLADHEAGGPNADYDRDGVSDENDVVAFLSDLQAGPCAGG